MELLTLLGRALQLLVLACLPEVGSPEPGPPGAALGALGALALLAAPALSFYLWRRLRTLESLAAAVGWTLTAIAAVVCARAYSAASAPLLRGYYFVAPLFWISLALTAASFGGRYLGSTIRGRKALSAVVVLVAGIVTFKLSYEYVASPDQMWKRVASLDPGNEEAIIRSQPDPRTAAHVSELVPALDACVRRNASSCACLSRRAFVRERLADLTGALADVRAGEAAKCDVDAGPIRLREVAVSALSHSAEISAAEISARVEGAADRATNPIFLYGDAVVANLRGDFDAALPLVKSAVELGQDRDAQLLYAFLLINRGQDDLARPVLESVLERFPTDPNALYDRALINDHAGDYNKARQGYLAALKADPRQKNARYNLAMLTLRQGIGAEAKHHAELFVRDYPDDLRGSTLLKMTGGQ